MKKLLSILLMALATTVGAQTFTVNNLQVNGALTGAVNGVALTSIAKQAANTVLANGTGAVANVTAFAMPSCSASTNALLWSSGTGFTCNSGLLQASTAASTYAPLVSPNFTGIPTVPNAALGTNTTQAANTAYVLGTFNAPPGGIGGVTPSQAAFTTLSTSGLYTPLSTVGIKGTVAADNPLPGSVGEVLTANTSGTSITSGTAVNAASLPLTAGDWDTQCVVQFLPAAATVSNTYAAGVSTTSATRPVYSQEGLFQGTTVAGNAANQMVTPTVRINTAGTPTIFCTAFAVFAGGTMTVSGTARARRMR